MCETTTLLVTDAGHLWPPHVTSVWPAFAYLMLSESAHNLDSPSGPKYHKQAALAVSVSLAGWVRVPWWAGRAVQWFVWLFLPPGPDMRFLFAALQRRCSSVSPPNTSLSLGLDLEIERQCALMFSSPKGQQVIARGTVNCFLVTQHTCFSMTNSWVFFLCLCF